jgi:DNA methylase
MLYFLPMGPGAFVPDRESAFYLLARHRQPLGENVAREYIEEFSAPGDLVVDPFAASPTTARVAAELGRRAIAVDSNPLVAFVAKTEAALPLPREIKNALARLGEVRKGDESLRGHIEALYSSACANCSTPVVVDYFFRALDVNAPVDKVYRCPSCGLRRDPTNDLDRGRAAEIKPRGFHYHLLLERIVGAVGEHGLEMRNLLKFYTPRNLYALVSITLKLDSEVRDEATREILVACLVHALDLGTSLYASPEGLPQRKVPDVFVEMNIWHALEAAVEGLCEAPRGPIPANSPGEVAEAITPGLFVGSGTARSLAATLAPGAALLLSSPARLDPLFWQLSYLWTRWTLGKTAAQPLEPLLDEERQRWGWYGNALTASLREGARLMRSGGRLAFCFPAGSHAMIEALCLAAAPIFRLESFAFRPSRGAAATTEFGAVRGDYRVLWKREDAEAPSKAMHEVAVKLRSDALIGSTGILAARGEPLAYSWVHHGALRQLADDGALAEVMATQVPARDNAFQFLRRELEAGLKGGYARDFDHWGASGHVLWVRRAPTRASPPLADRVETAVREIFETEEQISQTDLEDRVLAQFPELLTPEIELVEVCAEACAERVGGEWHLREVDRAGEVERAFELLSRLGAQLNHGVRAGEIGDPFALVWTEEKIVPASSTGSVQEARVHEDSIGFNFKDRVDMSLLVREPTAPLRGLVVIPESYVELAKEKLRRSPTLKKLLREAGWEFLRVPFVEMLLDSPSIERAEFQLALGLDPPLAEGKEQMELF